MPVRFAWEAASAAAVVVLTATWAVALLRNRKKRMRALAEESAWPALFGPAFQPHAAWGLWVRLAALLLVCVALLRPQWGEQWETVERKGLDLIVVLDVSRSMGAEDVAPNRLERARWELAELLSLADGDRIGLVLFAGDAQVLCPLTTDTRAFRLLLDDARPERLARGGTALPLALRAALDAMGPAGEADRVLLVISDGENHEGDLFALIPALREAGIRVFSIGVGTREGAPIPMPPEAGGGFVRDRRGHVVRTRLEEQPLRRLAEETGGAYVRATPEGFGIERLYTGPMAELRRARVEVRPHRLPRERFQLFLLAALLCLALEWRRVPTRRTKARKPGAGAAAVVLATLLTTGASPPDVREARYWMDAGRDALGQGEWTVAAEAFERAARVPPDRRLDPAVAWFNAGLARARAGEHAAAVEHFQRSVESPDPDVQRRAHLHAGGSHSQRAEAAADRADWPVAVERLEAAVRAYAEAMRLGLDAPDVRHRYQREIERLAEFRRRSIEAERGEAEPARPPDDRDGIEPGEDPGADIDPDGDRDAQEGEAVPSDAFPGIPQPSDLGAEPPEMAMEDAHRILDALFDEERAHRDQVRDREDPVPVEKDW